MSTSRNFAEMAGKLHAVATILPAAAAVAVVRAAVVVEASVRVASGRYAGSPLTRTATTVIGDAEALVRMTSRKAHLLDHDTKPHDITPRRGKVLLIPGAEVEIVHHPGTKGKLMWERGVEAALTPAIAAARQATVEQALKVFA